MKIDIDLKSGFLQNLKREVLDSLNTEERAIIEVSTGEMGNKPDAVKLGWLKMRTKETWTKQRYTKALGRTMEKLREAVAQAEKNKAGYRAASGLDPRHPALAHLEHLVLARYEAKIHVGYRASVNPHRALAHRRRASLVEGVNCSCFINSQIQRSSAIR